MMDSLASRGQHLEVFAGLPSDADSQNRAAGGPFPIAPKGNGDGHLEHIFLDEMEFLH